MKEGCEEDGKNKDIRRERQETRRKSWQCATAKVGSK